MAISYNEFQQKVLPDSFYAGLASTTTHSGPGWSFTFNPQLGTYVWGYKVGGQPQLYPGFTVEAQKRTATTVTFTNNLGTATNFPILQRYLTADQTIMFANPLGLANGNPAKFDPYSGPQPVVPHLHGGELRSDSDGGPDEWWTPGGEGYLSTAPAPGGRRGPGYFKNVYTYPNTQEAATIWFHDHVLGETRCNVYAGLAAFWFIRDQFDTGTPGTGLNLPAGAQEIELVFQDRQFDTEGQWLWPDGYPAGLNGPPTNPDIHPFWNPEFFGNVIVVNGKSWPYLQVEPRRYRLRLLNGSNARFYEIRLWNQSAQPSPTPGPPIYVIGTDGGLLNAPVITSSTDTNRLIIAPGERYDVIIDFANFREETLTLENYAPWPFPGGDPVDPNTDGQIMRFVVSAGAVADTSYDPSSGAPLRGGVDQPPAIVRLADPLNGTPGAGVTISKKRQLVLREVMGPGGPIEVLLNNTKFDGLREGTATPVPDSYKAGDRWMTELPQVGSTEEWEIINLTGDAHPIHLHLVQFQVMNRQTYDDVTYTTDYEALFPLGAAIDGYGPPGNYNQLNADGAIGGNPAVSSYLTGVVEPPLPQERGWKDTVIAYPSQVTRIISRWAPQDIAINGVRPGENKYVFNPTYGPGYVWHCHILDHEDNEMMRPYLPSRSPNNTLSRYGGDTGAISLMLLLNM
ncbi:MAG: multicopper oxidase [Syntrophales bacterium]|nr:multicopper oxidase [Syntrophales bacterium]